MGRRQRSVGEGPGPRLARVALAVLIGGLVSLPLLPSWGGIPPTTPPPIGRTPWGELGVPHRLSVVGLPGADPQGEPRVDISALAKADAARLASLRGLAPQPGNLTESPVRVAPALPTNALGVVTGTVLEPGSNTPVPSANLTLQTSAPPTLCSSGCPNTTSTANGSFRLSAPAGEYFLVASKPGFTENATQLTVLAGVTESVGAMYLLPDAVVTGRVVGSDPAHEPAAGVSVSSMSRNGQVLGPNASVAANGSFEVEVPPMPIRLDLAPPSWSPYLPNFTYLDPAPGTHLDVGTLELSRGTLVEATFVDAYSGATVNASAELGSCNARTEVCDYPRGPVEPNGSSVAVWASPGPTLLTAIAIGYVVNSTNIGAVPPEPPGTPVQVRVQLVPEGAFELTVNVTGGNPRVGGLSFDAFSWGWYDLRICSLDGVEVGSVGTPWNISNLTTPTCRWDSIGKLGTPTELVAPPLRDWVLLGGNFGVVPFWPNGTYFNLTPGRLLPGVYINYTPGAYVTGSVLLTGSSSPPGKFYVHACSSDNGLCGPSQGCVCAGANASSAVNASTIGCGLGPAAFCVAAPPGPSRLTVGGGFAHDNYTWVEVPRLCCSASALALGLANVTVPSVASINVSEGYGWTYGRVEARNATGALAPAILGEVSACPVNPSAAAPCGGGPVNSTGGFSFSAPLGWDSVTASQNGYLTNSTWTFVDGNNSSGEILLDPLGRVLGRALAPDGAGVYGGQVIACPLATPSACLDVGDGGTWAGGYYSGFLAGGAFPSGTYQVQVSASGYLANWTWVNVTSGTTAIVPTITLTPVSAPAGAEPRTRSSTGPPTNGQGSWVEGRVVDATTRRGIGGALVTACTVLSPVSCLLFPDRTSTFGTFNDSLPLATYWLNVTEPGYAPLSEFLNATSTTPVDLGVLSLEPYPWVSGRVGIAPWTGWSASAGLGPGYATVFVCSQTGSVCGPTGRLDTSGRFNVTGPPGLYDEVSIDGAGSVASSGSVVGGFDPLGVPVNVSGSGTSAGTNLSMSIFGVVTGYAGDLTTLNRSTGSSGPVGWGVVWAAGSNPGAPGADGFLTQDGRFDLFFPSGTSLTVNVSALGYSAVRNSSVTAPPPGGTLAMAPLLLPHFGWVRSTLRAKGGATVPFASVVGSANDPANKTFLIVNSAANGGGFFNLSAPPVTNLTLDASAPDFGPSRTYAAISMSRTSLVGFPPFVPAVTEFIARSLEVSTLGLAPLPTVVDGATGAPVPLATVAVVNGFDESASAPALTNGLGQFMTAGPVLPNETLVVEKPGYVTNDSPVPVPTPASVAYPRINLTGEAVLAGRVIAYPGLGPIAFANVTICPTGIVRCETVSTNDAGEFWATVTPGGLQVSFSALGYAANVSESAVVTTDRFAWLGTVELWELSLVRGTVVSAPFLRPLVGANVSLCPVNGSFALSCAVPTPTDPVGGFAVPLSGGTYRLQVNASGFSQVAFTLALAPAEVVNVGTIVLQPYGELAGEVVSGATGAAVPGAEVVACGNVSGLPCGPPGLTDTSGRYVVRAPPGPVTVGASASGFSNGYAYANVPPGATGQAPPIVLWPTGVANLYPVTGRVVSDRNGSLGLGGVTVSAFEGSAFVASTSSLPSGDFVLQIPFGTYTLLASAPGERAQRLPVVVAGPAGPYTIVLTTNTYALVGRVSEVYDGVPIPNASVAVGGWGIASTNSLGDFQLELPNGTFTVNVTGPGGPTSRYAPESFDVAVDAGPQVHDLALSFRGLPVHFEVADADSGLPVGGASGSLRGNTDFASPVNVSVVADPEGSFSVALPPGSYVVHVSAPGHFPLRVAFAVGTTPVALVLLLAPLGGAGPPSGTAWVFEGALAGSLVVVTIVVIRWRTRRSPRPAEGQPGSGRGGTEIEPETIREDAP